MRRLRGADAFHLYKESRTQHLHTIKVQILDPSSSHFAGDFDDFKREFERGVSVIPPFHWQLVKLPLAVAHPHWRYKRHLDIDYHVRRIGAAAPGGSRELDEAISEIASTGLERDRPLWQLWVVDGLADGRVAYVTKLHHAVADGVSSAQILLDAFDSAPGPAEEQPEHEWREDEPVPSAWALVVDSLRFQLSMARGFPRLLARTLRSWSISLARIATGKPRMASPFSAPRTRFNQPITPHRWFVNVDVSLADMKRVKEVLGGTLNDVFVAICSGALRRYLEARGELPKTALTASIPVSIREEHEKRTYGNRLSSWLVQLATDVGDPLERYRAIQRNTSAARESFEAKDRRLLADWQDYWWAYRLAVQGFQKLGAFATRRPGIHVILSNVKGPTAPVYSNGARIVGLRSMGPILDDTGLNFTGWSYVDTMSIGIVACREHAPDLRDLAENVRQSLAELLELAAKQADLSAQASTGDSSTAVG